jgi:predicted ribonuclease toxin of YeeF-YezG toxin-antitoxin module
MDCMGPSTKFINELNRKNDQMKNIRHSIQQFISLEDSLKGKAGKAIREYFEDVINHS